MDQEPIGGGGSAPMQRAPSFSVQGSIQPAVSNPNLHLQIGNYRLSKTLGIGSFGKVKLAQQCVRGEGTAFSWRAALRAAPGVCPGARCVRFLPPRPPPPFP